MERAVIADAVLWIELTSLADRLKVLPKSGGLLDQEESHLRKMKVVLHELDKREEELMNSEKHFGANR